MSNPPEPTVYVVSDDPRACQQLEQLFRAANLAVRWFPKGGDFLSEVAPWQPGCLWLEVHASPVSGLELLSDLQERGYTLPVIVFTSAADVSLAVSAMQAGAVDVIDDLHGEEPLLDRTRGALQTDAQQRRQMAEVSDVRGRLATLNEKEKTVLALLCAGRNNREVAAALKISRRAVESRRAKLMGKLQARSLADLIKLAMLGEAPPWR